MQYRFKNVRYRLIPTGFTVGNMIHKSYVVAHGNTESALLDELKKKNKNARITELSFDSVQ